MPADVVLDQDTSEARIAELIDAAKRLPDRSVLLALLPEQHPVYLDRGSNQTIRMRGYLLAAFEQAGLPEPALPYVLQELENGRDAYLVAGAARALRGLERPAASVVPFLLKAIENIRDRDDALTFDSYRPHWPVAEYTTALGELFKTFAWLGSHAHSALSDLEALYQREADFSTPARAHIRRAIDSIRARERPPQLSDRS